MVSITVSVSATAYFYITSEASLDSSDLLLPKYLLFEKTDLTSKDELSVISADTDLKWEDIEISIDGFLVEVDKQGQVSSGEVIDIDEIIEGSDFESQIKGSYTIAIKYKKTNKLIGLYDFYSPDNSGAIPMDLGDPDPEDPEQLDPDIDTTSPSITVQEIEDAQTVEDVTISAEILDDLSTSEEISAFLDYKSNIGGLSFWTSAIMNYDGNEFLGTIPEEYLQLVGDEFQELRGKGNPSIIYRVRAYDLAENEEISESFNFEIDISSSGSQDPLEIKDLSMK